MNTDTIKLIIVGSKGRMGEALARLAGQDPKLELVSGVDKGDNVLDSIDRCDVLVEFAHHSLSGDLAKTAADHGKAMVIGTTGHTADERKAVETAARRIPIVFAPNFSVGVNLLFYLTQLAAETLGEDYDQEVVEMHHRQKLDAPSGTARRLGEILAQASGGAYDDLALHGRHGDVGRAAQARDRHARAARRQRRGRSHRPFFHPWRAARTHPPRLQPGHLRLGRPSRCPMGPRAKARPLFHARRAWVEAVRKPNLLRITGVSHSKDGQFLPFK